jgi:hypothetical protein
MLGFSEREALAVFSTSSQRRRALTAHRQMTKCGRNRGHIGPICANLQRSLVCIVKMEPYP